MLSEAVKRIIEELSFDQTFSPGDCILSNPDYEPIPFTKNNFHEYNLDKNKRKIVFVDGGTQMIFQTPTLSIHLNRIYSNIFRGAERIGNLNFRIDFFSVTTAELINNHARYRIKIYPINLQGIKLFPDHSDEIEFEPRSETQENDETVLDIDRVTPIARRFGEWTVSNEMLERINDGDIIVMDGTLKSSFPKESSYTGNLFSKARSKGVIYCGLAKTSGLLTNRYYPLLSTVKKISIQNSISGPWYYHPIARSRSPAHAADLLVVKLNKESKRVFRLDIQSESFKELNSHELDEVMSQLSINSSDVSFPGYPYGLVDADLNARVKYGEVEIYRTHLSSEMSRKEYWQTFLDDMQTTDAHDVLNSLIKGK